jgi:hypothetical protein
MNIVSKFKDNWRQSFINVSDSILDDWDLPELTLDFLGKVGLPFKSQLVDELGLGISFEAHNNSCEYRGHHYYKIGWIGSFKLCLRESSGEVYLLGDSKDGTPILFVNATIWNLLLFLQMIQARRSLMIQLGRQIDDPLVGLSRDQKLERRRELKAQLVKEIQNLGQLLEDIDVRAMSLQSNYWPTILQDWLRI